MITSSTKYLLGLLLSLLLLPAIILTSNKAQAAEEVAVFAGGCFWCMEEVYDKVAGVTKTTSGYSGGNSKNPSYKEVTFGRTGHREALEVHYDNSKVTYQQLLTIFWHNIDPLDDGGQFCDRGFSYRSAIFYVNEEQRKQAEASLQQLRDSKVLSRKIVTPIIKFKAFYAAEEYHQDYHSKNPLRYKYYKYGCGRPARLKELWGEVSNKK